MIIIILSILCMFLAFLAFRFHKLARGYFEALEKTKKYYSTVLDEQNEAISEKIPKDGKCPFSNVKCWRAYENASLVLTVFQSL